MDFWYWIFKNVTRIYRSLTISKLIVLGNGNIPPGPKVYAGNHPNTADAMVLPSLLPDRLHFLGYADTFKIPVWGWLLSLADQIRVGPGLGRSAMNQAISRLNLGNSLVILPEGRMTLREEVRKPGTSAVRLSLKTGVPIVPFCFYVPQEYVRSLKFQWFGRTKSSRWQVGGTCYVVIGEPWYVSKAINGKPNAKVIRQLSQQLMDRIEDLTQKAIENART